VTGRADVLADGGECNVCGEYAAERLVIRIIEQGSGPGGSAFGCVPCARREAARKWAPDWLRANVAALDVTAPGHLRSTG
jgi:hypothetical protein